MRLHLIHEGSTDFAALRRQFGPQVDVRISPSVHRAMEALRIESWRPDLVVVDPDLDGRFEPGLLDALRNAAGGVPVILAAPKVGSVVDLLHTVENGLGPLRETGRGELSALIDALTEQQRVLGKLISAHRLDLVVDMERIASQAAERAVAHAIEKAGFGLKEEESENLKVALRFARGWEDAKGRFLQAVTTGIAGAFLLALGAGIAALIRQSAGK